MNTLRNLISELATLRELFQSTSAGITPSIASMKSSLLSLTSPQRVLLPEVSKLFKLLLVLPATNATSERTFSALRRVKSYLRSTMSQSRLNHLMILHYHQDIADKLDLKIIGNEYIPKNEGRRSTFVNFS